MTTSLQPLAQLPFRLEYQFEYRLLQEQQQERLADYLLNKHVSANQDSHQDNIQTHNLLESEGKTTFVSDEPTRPADVDLDARHRMVVSSASSEDSLPPAMYIVGEPDSASVQSSYLSGHQVGKQVQQLLQAGTQVISKASGHMFSSHTKEMLSTSGRQTKHLLSLSSQVVASQTKELLEVSAPVTKEWLQAGSQVTKDLLQVGTKKLWDKLKDPNTLSLGIVNSTLPLNALLPKPAAAKTIQSVPCLQGINDGPDKQVAAAVSSANTPRTTIDSRDITPKYIPVVKNNEILDSTMYDETDSTNAEGLMTKLAKQLLGPVGDTEKPYKKGITEYEFDAEMVGLAHSEQVRGPKKPPRLHLASTTDTTPLSSPMDTSDIVTSPIPDAAGASGGEDMLDESVEGMPHQVAMMARTTADSTKDSGIEEQQLDDIPPVHFNVPFRNDVVRSDPQKRWSESEAAKWLDKKTEEKMGSSMKQVKKRWSTFGPSLVNFFDKWLLNDQEETMEATNRENNQSEVVQKGSVEVKQSCQSSDSISSDSTVSAHSCGTLSNSASSEHNTTTSSGQLTPPHQSTKRSTGTRLPVTKIPVTRQVGKFQNTIAKAQSATEKSKSVTKLSYSGKHAGRVTVAPKETVQCTAATYKDAAMSDGTHRPPKPPRATMFHQLPSMVTKPYKEMPTKTLVKADKQRLCAVETQPTDSPTTPIHNPTDIRIASPTTSKLPSPLAIAQQSKLGIKPKSHSHKQQPSAKDCQSTIVNKESRIPKFRIPKTEKVTRPIEASCNKTVSEKESRIPSVCGVIRPRINTAKDVTVARGSGQKSGHVNPVVGVLAAYQHIPIQH